MGDVTIDAVIAAYVKTRDSLDKFRKEFKEREAEIKALQEKRENWLASQLTATGQTSAATPHGTAFFSSTESATVADWDVLLDYILTNESYELLERRVSKTAVLEIMGHKRDQAPPPGINYTSIRCVNVRRNKTEKGE
jgi:septal ring factor EnvC (AmiA/AmiB activator)